MLRFLPFQVHVPNVCGELVDIVTIEILVCVMDGYEILTDYAHREINKAKAQYL